MPANSEQFAKAVVAARLLSARDLNEFWNSLPGGARPATAEAYAAALVQAGRLTPQQASQVLSGLGQSVVIVASPKSENMALKLIGGAFATLIAPLIVTLIINRFDNRPELPPPAAPVPVAAVAAPQPVAAPIADASVIKPPETAVVARPALEMPAAEPQIVRAQRPVSSTAPATAASESESGGDAGRKKEKPAAPAAPSKPKPLAWPSDGGKAAATQREWAKFLKTPVEIDNSLGMKLVLIPPGSFLMGNTEKRRMQVARALKLASELERMRDEAPQHRVNYNGVWLMGATEVTIGQFARFVTATKYATDAERSAGDGSKKSGGKNPPSWREPGYPVTNDSPVTQVSWGDAVAFCNWLSESEKRKPCYRRENDSWVRMRGANGYRLPSEAKWEYSCRAGTASEFYFGDDPGAMEKFGWYLENSDHCAKPVGQKRANAWGLHDMHGNVREWCDDWYAADYYADSAPHDPHGPATGGQRVARGGSWYSTAVRARSADRDGLAPTYHSNQVGFRVERAL